MYASSFDESNFVFDTPPGVPPEEIHPLCVHIGTTEEGIPVIISKWKATKEELDEIMETGCVWVWHYGTSLQPHTVTGNNPFKQQETK